jgi:hypothetical protein
MMQYLTGGADLTAIAPFINRIALGAFFTISGFHLSRPLLAPKRTCRSRRKTMRVTIAIEQQAK